MKIFGIRTVLNLKRIIISMLNGRVKESGVVKTLCVIDVVENCDYENW
jgi:hypothetical protein